MVVTLASSATGAAADAPSPRWLLVVVSHDDQHQQAATQTSQMVERHMMAMGFPIYAGVRASDWFASNLSKPHRTLGASEHARLKPCVDGTLRQIVDGNQKRASQTAEECLAPIDKDLDAYNDDAETATQVYNICLLKVRALLEEGKADQAYRYSLKCRRLVPDAKPSTHLHPPEVVALVMQADSDLHTQPHSTLNVRSSEPSCTVFLNGRRAGQSPFRSGPLPGGSYSVKLQCPYTGESRVHRVHLGADPVTIRIDQRFDRSLTTDGASVGLSYNTLGAVRSLLLQDLAMLAQRIHASEVFIVTAETPDLVRLDRYVPARNEIVASVWLRLKDQPSETINDALDLAMNALIHERSLDLSAGHVMETSPWQTEPSDGQAAEGHDHRAFPVATPLWLGIGLGAVGVAGLGTGWILQQQYSSANGEQSRGWHWLAGGIGAASLSSALPFLLPAEPGVPWWAWVSGAVGLGLGVYGTYGALLGGGCAERYTDGSCQTDETNTGLGDMMILSAIPLIAVPITYLLRPVFGSDESSPSLNVQASTTNFSLALTMRQ